MSDKASSDLDVFDGLAAKKSRPSGSAPAPLPSRGPVPPPSSPRQKTLLGLPAPVKPGAPPPPPAPSKPPAPPALHSSLPPAPPPPPPKTQTGGFPPPPPPPTMSAGPKPPPAPSGAQAVPPPPPPALSAPKGREDDDATPLPKPRPNAPAVSAPPKPPTAPVLYTPLPAVPLPPAALSPAALPRSPLPAAPPPPPAAAKPGVDIDWDDEDEATQVFDKGIEDTARALLHSAPPPPPAAGAPPPPPAAGAPPSGARVPSMGGRPLTVPPPSVVPRAPLPPPPKAMQPLPAAPAAAFEPPPPTITLPQQRAGRSGLWMIIAAAVVVGAAATAYALMPKKGSLVVSVAGPGGKAIDGVQVYVDGSQRCDASPCQVTDLSRGVHFVKVAAAGYTTTAPKAVKINAGEESAENVQLARGSEGSGLKVVAEGAGLRLSVDGKDYGPLPQEIKDIAPGEHTVKIDGGERYESMEKQIVIEAEKLFSLEPKLKVKKGLATIKAGSNADGAKVLLVSGTERRPVPSLPLRVDITSDKPYSIVATKKGFGEFKQSIEFEDGQAERTFVVDLSDTAAEEKKEAPSGAAPGPKPAAPTAPAAPTPVAEKPAAPVAAAGKGTLNINSIPVSNVILDGKPLGQTPKVGVSVSPGPHTVIFVHPEHGRKAKSVTVEAGKTAAAIVRFP